MNPKHLGNPKFLLTQQNFETFIPSTFICKSKYNHITHNSITMPIIFLKNRRANFLPQQKTCFFGSRGQSLIFCIVSTFFLLVEYYFLSQKFSSSCVLKAHNPLYHRHFMSLK